MSRKIKRFYSEDYLYFVTCNTKYGISFFREPIFCDLWIEELKIAKELKSFKLYSFCLNYNHFHLIVKCTKGENISRVMKFFKENISRDINKILSCAEEKTMSPCKNENEAGNGDETASSRKSEKKTASSRKSQNKNSAFLKIDDFLDFKKYQFRQKYPNHRFPKFVWQASFHDHVIRNEKDFIAHDNYCKYNYLKHDLPMNWKYTSNNYMNLCDLF